MLEKNDWKFLIVLPDLLLRNCIVNTYINTYPHTPTHNVCKYKQVKRKKYLIYCPTKKNNILYKTSFLFFNSYLCINNQHDTKKFSLTFFTINKNIFLYSKKQVIYIILKTGKSRCPIVKLCVCLQR